MSRRDRIAKAALTHAGSSSIVQVSLYEDVVRRPADAGPAFDDFYLHNKLMSSCALFALGCLRLCGCTEPECVAPYFPKGGPERDAMADIQKLARRFNAWTSASMPMDLPKAGDIWIIADENENDAHTGVCVSDAVRASSPDVNAPGATFTVSTVEGGQYSGRDSSAISAFSRTFRCVNNRWALGKPGQERYLLGYATAGSLPVPDDDPAPPSDPLPANGVQTDTKT